MIAVNFLSIHNKSNSRVSIGDLNLILEPFEAKNVLGSYTLKEIMDSGGLSAFLDQKLVCVDIQLDDEVKQLGSSGALRAALKDVVKCHTCGNSNS